MSNILMSCEETGNCPTREREGYCEGCVMIKALDYGENSFDNSDDGDDDNSFDNSDDEIDDEIEEEEEDQNQDLIPEEDQLEVEEQE